MTQHHLRWKRELYKRLIISDIIAKNMSKSIVCQSFKMKLCDCFFSLINIDNIKLYLQFLTSYIMIYFEFNQVQFIKKIELYGIV